MVRVVLLGGGNLAFHLANTFAKNEHIELMQVYNRTLSNIQKLEKFAPITDTIEDVKIADIYIIATSDNVIADISLKLGDLPGLIVHTSGATEMDVLASNNRGVFYPLQSFTKEKNVNFNTIPLCLETNNKEDYFILEKLATAISEKVYPMTSKQRKKLHVAAVFVNNFVNYMYGIGEKICLENKIPFEVLIPLIQETADKMETLSPSQAQTGPAIRNDKETIAAHKKELKKEETEIYNLLTEAILNTQIDGNKL